MIRAASILARLLAAALVALQPVPASAQVQATATPADQSEIVIEGKRRQALSAFVDRLAAAGPTDQLGRWKNEVCPAVAGIDTAQAEWIERRIMDTAKPLHLRRPSNCLPNLIVIISPQADALAKAIAGDFPRDDGQWRINRFLKDQRPVRWLTVTTECADRCELPNSRIEKATTPAFIAVLILVDADRLTGYSLGELADYVALVGLSNPAQSNSNPSTSILSMFDDPKVAGETYSLTGRDKAFLTGLYNSPMNASARMQKGAITSALRKAESSGKPPK